MQFDTNGELNSIIAIIFPSWISFVVHISSFHVYWIGISSLHLPHFFKPIKNFLPSAFHCSCSCCDYSIINASKKNQCSSPKTSRCLSFQVFSHHFSAFQLLIHIQKEIMSISFIANDHWLMCRLSLFIFLQITRFSYTFSH